MRYMYQKCHSLKKIPVFSVRFDRVCGVCLSVLSVGVSNAGLQVLHVKE